MKNNFFVNNGTNSIRLNIPGASPKKNISKSSAVKNLLFIAVLILIFENTYSQTPISIAKNTSTTDKVFAEKMQNKGPEAFFCINGILATNNQSLEVCTNSPVRFSLCAIENGMTPLNVCWMINGAEECETGLVQGDVLFESTFDQGIYTIQITSITDSEGNSALGLNAYNYSFETVSPASVSAGNDMTICEGFTYTLNQATAENYNSLLWTGGDGTFVPSAKVLKPVYIPGSQDILNGGTSLCLSANSENPCTNIAADCIALTIQQNATSNAGADVTVCESQTYAELNGLVINGFPVWEEAMFTGGFFENNNTNSTKYYFSAQDIELGTIGLCLTAIPTAPCFVAQSDCVNLTISGSPEVNAGSDLSVCANEAVLLNEATAENYSALQWATSGDGVFVNPNTLNTVYLPGTSDLSTGMVQICLNAFAQGVCTITNADCMEINIIHTPEIDMPSERKLVYEDYDVDNGKWLPVEIGNTVSGDYESIIWMTNGDGTFDDASAESPAYFPGLNDSWNGEIVIYVTLEPLADCHSPVFQGMTIHIPQQFVYYDNDGWNGISSYLSTDLENVTEVMDPLVEIPGSKNLISMFDIQGKIYMPEFNPPLATLTNWEPVGYKINLKNTMACLPVYGDSLSDQTFTVNGPFTYLPVLTNIPVSIESLFEGHLDDIMLILDWSGSKLWTPLASDFDSIYPGYAYLLVNQSGVEPYTIEFPDFVADAPLIYPIRENKNALISNLPWPDVETSDMPHIFTFTDEALSKLQPGDILGVFNKNGECFGMANNDDHESFYKLIAMGKSNTSTYDHGFAEGEAMYFRVHNIYSGQESEVEYIFDSNYPVSKLTFMGNTLTVVTNIIFKNMSVDQSSEGKTTEVNVYPNPASEYLNISSGEIIKEIVLMDSRGQEVHKMQNNEFSATLDVSNLSRGIYIVTIKHENQQATTKKVTIK
ncbi:MAG: T9SS type A sorting domain-containing protein [Bacteroidales bacterium]|nr:T9SS type A sorting domain-containing protein [Bacteroidales bacterium]